MIHLDIYTASKISIKECVEKLRSDAQNGLTQEESIRRLEFNGYNEFEMKQKESLFGKYLEQV